MKQMAVYLMPCGTILALLMTACTTAPSAPAQSTPVIPTAVTMIAPAAASNPTTTTFPTATPVPVATTGSVPAASAERPLDNSRTAVEAIREFEGSPEWPVTYVGTGTHPENSSMAVEEYESADATFMVELQSKLVVYMQKKNGDSSSKAALSSNELEHTVRAFLATRNPCFGAAEDLLKFTTSGKVGNRFFRWQSPRPDAERPWDQPVFIQVGVSAAGTIFGYVDSGICELARNRPAHVTPIPTDTPIPTPEPLFQCGLAATIAADKYPGWFQCNNAKYGFSFRYPAEWKLKEISGSVNTMSGHAVHLLHPTDPAVRLIIAFKRADEEQRIAPTGMGGGELVSRGVVSLFGQEVERLVRVEQGKDMAVYYGWPRSAITGNDLAFWLALDCACSTGDPATTGLTPEVEQLADAVVESIEVTK